MSNLFTNYDPVDRRRGSPSGGNRWISFSVKIPKSYQIEFLNYILNSDKEALRGIKRNGEPDEFIGQLSFILPVISTVPPLNRERGFNLAIETFDVNNSYIRGIGPNHNFGVAVTKQEVKALRELANEFFDDKLRNYQHYISNDLWNENSYEYLKDPVTLSLLKEPVIASDGFTYSKKTLDSIIEGNRKSPLTREVLRPIGINGKYGIENKIISQMLEKFIKGKLKVSLGGGDLNKYKINY